MNGLQPRFFTARALFESREEPARMYHWSIFVITVGVTETIANLMTGTLFFLPWYFVVGFENDMSNAPGRGAYEWLLFVSITPPCPIRSISIKFKAGKKANEFQLMFETWVSTFGQLLAAIAPTEQTARLFIPMVFVFVTLFCGVLQPLSLLPEFWHFVHYASPFTWLVG